MIVVEIIYCIVCMALYLILIYWSSQNEPEVILGREKPELNLDEFDNEYEGLALVPNYIAQQKLWQYNQQKKTSRNTLNNSVQHPTIREKPKLEIDYRKLRQD